MKWKYDYEHVGNMKKMYDKSILRPKPRLVKKGLSKIRDWIALHIVW